MIGTAEVVGTTEGVDEMTEAVGTTEAAGVDGMVEVVGMTEVEGVDEMGDMVDVDGLGGAKRAAKSKGPRAGWEDREGQQ